MEGDLEPELKYGIKCRSAGDPLAHLDSTGFLDFFEERFMPAHYSLLSSDRLSWFAPSAKIYIAAPQNPRGGECSAHGKPNRPLGRYMQEALAMPRRGCCLTSWCLGWPGSGLFGCGPSRLFEALPANTHSSALVM